MEKVTQKFTIQSIADVSSVLKSIETIKKSLDKLEIKPETKASFENLFSKMEKQAERASDAFASGFKRKGDVEKYTDALDQISSGYDRIVNKIDILKTKKITLNGDFSKLEEAEKEVKRLKKELDSFKADVGPAMTQAINGLHVSVAGHKGKGWQAVLDSFKDGVIDVQALEKAIKDLNTQYEKGIKTKGSSGPNSEYWQDFKRDLDSVQQNLNNYNAAVENVTNAETLLSQKQQEVDAYLNEGTKALTEADKAAREAAVSSRDYANSAEKAAKETQQLHSELENFKNKAAYFFGLSNAINLFKRSLRSAYNTVKDLDAVMTETAVVTDFNVGDMWSQLPEYTRRANELGVTIHDTYEAATLFYQQGLKTNEVMQISNETLKMARIAGLDAATASDRMTNALRGFNMELDKTSAQRVNDVYSKLAAITASNTDEISTAMTKVASLAHNANMEFETTAAFLAQIIESTRESAETAGTALKTVVARFSEVKKLYSKGELMGSDEEGEEIDVNKVSTALRSAGIDLNEYLTGAKGLDDIFIELADKWDSLDQVQQRYIATMAAGSRQQSRFIALMSDYKRTAQLVDAANNANGASQEQYNKTLESLQTKLARLKNAWNEFVLGLANSDAIKVAVDLLTKLITTINNLIKTVSGKNAGAKMITSFITAFTAFKVGQGIFNKGAFGGLFTQLAKFGSRAAGEAGANTANVFYSKLADKLVRYSKGGGIIGSVEKAEASLGNRFNSFFTADASFMEGALFDKLKPEIGVEKFNVFWNSLDKGNLTVEQLNQALKDTGSKLQIDATNAEQFGIKWKGNNTVIGQGVLELKQASAAAMALGSAFMLIGNILEKEGGEWEVFGKIVKTLGAGLMVFGTIMSVWLPLQVQIGTKGISAAIYKIPIIGWITLVISLVVSLGVALASIAKNNSAEVKLEKAAEAAENAAQAAEDAKKAFNELNEAWRKLDDKYAVIENATKGTTEWKNAVKELNDQVLELMNTYKGLHIERDKDGILRITNKEEYTDKQRQNTLEAEAAARFSKIREYNRDQDVRDKGLKSNWLDDKVYKSTVEKLRESGDLEKVADMTPEEIYKILEKDFNERGIHKGAPISIYQDPNWYTKDVQTYARNYKENQASIKSQQSALGSTILQNADVNEDTQKYVNTFLSDAYLKKVVEKSQKKYEHLWDGETKAKYAENKGYDNWKSYVAEHSEDKDVTVTELKDRMAAADALNEATDQVRIFASNLEKLDSYELALFGEQGGGGLTKAQANNLDRYSDDQIRAIYDNLGGDKTFGQGAFESYFKEWFRTTVDEAVSNFKVEDKYGKEFSDKISSSLTEGLDSEAFKNFTENMWSIFTASGYEGLEKIQNSLEGITENMDPEDAKAFISSLKGIDWTSSNSIHTLSELAKEYGVSEEAANELEEQIIRLNNAATKVDLKKVTEQLKSVLKIGKDINTGTQGRSFSEEQMNKLIEAGISKDKFVYNIETGKYDYTGVLQDILDSINKLVNETFDTEQLEKDIASGKAAQNVLGEKTPTTYGEKTIAIKNYIDEAGKNSKIDSKMFNYAINEATARNNYAIIDKLIAIIEKDANSYNDNKKTLEEQTFNRDVMAHQMNSASVNGSRAIWGDKAARKALEGQVSSSGMSEQLKEKLLTGMTPGTMTDNITSIDWTKMAGNITDTFAQAKSFGVDSKELEAYANSLRQINGLENMRLDNLYQLALAETNYQKGQQSLYDSYDDWTKLIQKNGGIVPDGSIEQGKVFSKLKDDLKQMLNLTEDLPDSFLKTKDNVDLLKKAVKGDKDAVEKLRTAAAKVQLGKIDIKDKDLKNNITNKIDELSKKMPDLKIGASLDSTDAGKDLMDFVNKAGMSVEDIQKLFNSLGWAPEIKWLDLSYTDATKAAQSGTVYQRNPDGSYEPVKLDGEETLDASHSYSIPQIGPKTSKVASKPPKKNPPKKKSKGKGKGGGGKKKAKAKKERWENPYDELYNLQEKINEALRKREALERRYQKLLKQQQTSLKDIRAAYYDQIKQMRTEASLQRELAAGRLRQIENIGKETYVKSNGKVTTFEKMGVLKYASWDKNTGELQIDWDAIQKLEGTKHVETGKAVVEYISKLEELTKSYEETRDTLWDIEDKIEDLRQEVIDSYMSFEERVMEAVVNRYQKQIDNYQAMSDAIDKVNNEVLKSLREQVDLSRQIRDNTKKEEDISKKENRLAYLRRDTSGANDLEILSLEKELKEAREGYSDDLVDQAIDKMQDDADKASEQRTRQIETMQAQLDIAKETGALWKEVWGLMNEAAAGDGALSPYSNLVNLLKETEAFQSLSEIGKSDWFQKVTEEYLKAQTGKNEAEDKFKVDANGDGVVKNTNTQNTINEVAGETKTYKKLTPRELNGIALAAAVGGYGWSKEFKQLKAQLKGKNILPAQITSIINKVNELIRVSAGQLKNNNWKNLAIARKNKITNLKPYAMSKFKTGGLADKTGPAWLDGTKTNPELVLNAQDTRNFIALKDILASLMNTQKTGNKTSTGNNYFDIDIHADIGSDYDVDKLANRLKKIIFEDGQYRNVNTINLLR